MTARKPRFTRAFRIYRGLVVFSLGGLTLGWATGMDALWIARIVSLLTLGTAVYVVTRTIPAWLCAVVLLIGVTSEIIGLYTGFPFGHYVYTGQWWPSISLPGGKVFPLQLPFAWLMMVGACYSLVTRWLAVRNVTAVGVLTGLAAAIADFPMEYTMVRVFDYWRWPNQSGFLVAPWMNFLGWWLTGSIAGTVLAAFRAEDQRNPEPSWVLAIHVGFCAAVYALWLLMKGPAGQ